MNDRTPSHVTQEQNTYITHVLRSSFAEFDAYQRELVKISRSSSSR